MIAPKGPAIPCVRIPTRGGVALADRVHKEPSGNAHDWAFELRPAIAVGRSGLYRTSFKEECRNRTFRANSPVPVRRPGRTDQGGLRDLVEAGYRPEMAY